MAAFFGARAGPSLAVAPGPAAPACHGPGTQVPGLVPWSRLPGLASIRGDFSQHWEIFLNIEKNTADYALKLSIKGILRLTRHSQH